MREPVGAIFPQYLAALGGAALAAVYLVPILNIEPEAKLLEAMAIGLAACFSGNVVRIVLTSMYR